MLNLYNIIVLITCQATRSVANYAKYALDKLKEEEENIDRQVPQDNNYVEKKVNAYMLCIRRL